MNQVKTKYVIPVMDVILLEAGSCVLNNYSGGDQAKTMVGGIEDTMDEEWDL